MSGILNLTHSLPLLLVGLYAVSRSINTKMLNDYWFSIVPEADIIIRVPVIFTIVVNLAVFLYVLSTVWSKIAQVHEEYHY